MVVGIPRCRSWLVSADDCDQKQKGKSFCISGRMWQCSGLKLCFFLASLFWSRLWSLVFSKFSMRYLVAALHAVRSWAISCHFPIGMLHALRVDFKRYILAFFSLPANMAIASWELGMEQLFWQPSIIHSYLVHEQSIAVVPSSASLQCHWTQPSAVFPGLT